MDKHNESRRKLIKAVAYTAPVVLTLRAAPTFATSGSGVKKKRKGSDEPKYGSKGSKIGSKKPKYGSKKAKYGSKKPKFGSKLSRRRS